jgi:2-polyprenyl-3-methyl-5-hydroxy-6-metoxy-1,4-benzoquinol methylase
MNSNPEIMHMFQEGMWGQQLLNNRSLAEKFNFSQFNSLTDIGAGGGNLSICIAEKHPNIKCTNVDLSNAIEYANRKVTERSLNNRITNVVGNFNTDDFPKSDVIVMGNILHTESLQQKLSLLKKAYDAINPGGVYIAIEIMLDSNRRERINGFIMALMM